MIILIIYVKKEIILKKNLQKQKITPDFLVMEIKQFGIILKIIYLKLRTMLS